MAPRAVVKDNSPIKYLSQGEGEKGAFDAKGAFSSLPSPETTTTARERERVVMKPPPREPADFTPEQLAAAPDMSVCSRPSPT